MNRPVYSRFTFHLVAVTSMFYFDAAWDLIFSYIYSVVILYIFTMFQLTILSSDPRKGVESGKLTEEHAVYGFLMSVVGIATSIMVYMVYESTLVTVFTLLVSLFLFFLSSISATLIDEFGGRQ